MVAIIIKYYVPYTFLSVNFKYWCKYSPTFSGNIFLVMLWLNAQLTEKKNNHNAIICIAVWYSIIYSLQKGLLYCVRSNHSTHWHVCSSQWNMIRRAEFRSTSIMCVGFNLMFSKCALFTCAISLNCSRHWL